MATDSTPDPVASDLVLLEDGRPLGPAHALHDTVREVGGGTYSHWGDELWLSTPDDSDPRTNGRRYTVEARLRAPVALLLGALALLAFGTLLATVDRLQRRPAPLDRLRRRGGNTLFVAAGLAGVAVLALHVWPPIVEQEILVVAAGPIDLFGDPRPWHTPPLCVGVWPDEVVAEHAGTVRFGLPVVPSPGALVVVAMLAVTGAWLRWPRRGTEPHGPWAALMVFGVQAAVPTALTLLTLNTVGTLSRPLRAPLDGLPVEPPFGALDRPLTWSEVRLALPRRTAEATADFVERLTFVVADAVAHVWDRRFARELRLQVPARENWCLWLLGELDPAQREYFFVDARRMLERGVGMCGQVAYALGEVLADAGVDARIAQLGGHTVVVAFVDGSEWVLDPDYRVVLPHPLAALAAEPELAAPAYEAALRRFGRDDAVPTAAAVAALFDADGNQVSSGRPAADLPFATHLRERIADAVRWSLPLLLLAVWVGVELAGRRRAAHSAVPPTRPPG